jgi:thioredoxin reductase (NADPH)
LTAALLRRFGADYRVLALGAAEAAITTLDQLARQSVDVALIAADLDLAGTDGVAFLERAHTLHRRATRALLVDMDARGTRIPAGAITTLQRASALGKIDFSILKGWVSPDEWLYPQVQEALSRWTKANRPHHEVMRIVGEHWSPRSHELRNQLDRNTVPFGFYPSDSDEGRRLIDAHQVDPRRLPAIIRHDGTVMHDPSPAEVAEALGVRTRTSTDRYDLVILGGGPAGLSAAVSAASEGLRTLVIEPQAIGGQAGSSSLIRNYLGFPRGISGGELTFRAYEQAMLFGTEFVFTQRATGLIAGDEQHWISLSDGSQVSARAIMIATGVDYRRLDIPALDRLVGVGVFYGAVGVEAPSMAGQDVYVVGGANSAGQAAIHLAKYAARVTVVVRGPSLASMSDYLITELSSTPNVEVRLNTRVVDGRGDLQLEGLVLQNSRTREHEEVRAAAVFVLIGAETRADWLGDELQRDFRGYILTGNELAQSRTGSGRKPLPFETSLPGVFAIGDVRHGSVKRVAGAVGDGSMAVSSVHQYLAASRVVASVGD